MEMEQKILVATRRKRGLLTPVRLANNLNIELGAVNKSLSLLEKQGKLRIVTLEGLIRAGK
jgi:hypothetical protein